VTLRFEPSELVPLSPLLVGKDLLTQISTPSIEEVHGTDLIDPFVDFESCRLRHATESTEIRNSRSQPFANK
jgi:hypothetical protein